MRWVAGLGVSLAMALGLGGWTPRSWASVCPAELAAAVDATLERQPTRERSHWGILVETADGAETIYAQNAEQFLIPASNVKLLTTAAALDQLGADYQIRTSIYGTTLPQESTLHVLGRGDPSLETDQLQELAQQLQDQGITTIRQLIAYESHFQGDPILPNWDWEDVQARYGPPVNSLILNGNTVPLQLIPAALGEPLRIVWPHPTDALGWQIENSSRTVSSTEPEFIRVERNPSTGILRISGQLHHGASPADAAFAAPDPTQRFLNEFRQVLEAADIRVHETAIAPFTARPPDITAPEIAAVLSPPLSALLFDINGNSNNLYAEALLQTLGVQMPLADTDNPRIRPTTLEAGLAAVSDILQRLGVDPTGIALADGSGIARKNLVTPRALVETLQAMARHPEAERFRQSLAIAAETGSLRNRFRDTAAAGRLYGKTGALSGVASLSGYLDPPNHAPLTFSIIVNHFDYPVSTVRPLMDELILHFATLQPCDPQSEGDSD